MKHIIYSLLNRILYALDLTTVCSECKGEIDEYSPGYSMCCACDEKSLLEFEG